MTEKVTIPKDFIICGLGHLRITNYDGAYFDGQEIGKIIRQAAGLEEGNELGYPGAFAEISIKVRFAKPYLKINNKLVGMVVEQPEVMEMGETA